MWFVNLQFLKFDFFFFYTCRSTLAVQALQNEARMSNPDWLSQLQKSEKQTQQWMHNGVTETGGM